MIVHLIKTKYAHPWPIQTLCEIKLKQRKQKGPRWRKPLVDVPYTHSVDKCNCRVCLIVKRARMKSAIRDIDFKIEALSDD